MEYCELGDLDNYVKEHGRLAEDQVWDIGWQILRGLRFMHDNDFAHRDLKPAVSTLFPRSTQGCTDRYSSHAERSDQKQASTWLVACQDL